MGACKSKIEGGSSALAVNEAAISHLETKIKNKLQKQSNVSSKSLVSKQNITIREKRGGNNQFLLNKKMSVKKGPFGIFGSVDGCDVYGCAYDVKQVSNMNIISYNSNVVNESEDIYNDISTNLKQKAKTQMSSSAANAANRALDSVKGRAVENIKSKLLNLSATSYNNQQNITIEYETPPRCKDPCGVSEEGTRGPSVGQDAMVQIQSADILSSTLKVIEEKLAEHKIKVKQEISSDNDACIIQLAISALSCLGCLLIIWKLLKMAEKGAKGAMNAASNMDPEQMAKMADMASSVMKAKNAR